MNRPAPQLIPRLRAEQQRLLPGPPQPACEVRQAKSLEPAAQSLERPQPQLLEPLVAGPRVGGPLPLDDGHVLEAGVAHVALVLGGGEDGAARVGGGGEDVVAPLGEVAGGVEGGVVAADGDGELLELEVAARF